MKIPEGITELDVKALSLPKLEKGYRNPGSFVAVRPANHDRTYLGLYLGDMPIGIGAHKRLEEGKLVLSRVSPTNPCIYVFDLHQLVYGIESWWGEIETEKHLRQITDHDIDNVWYVRALKQMAGPKGDQGVVRVDDDESDKLDRIRRAGDDGTTAAFTTLMTQSFDEPSCSSSSDSSSSSCDSGSAGGGE